MQNARLNDICKFICVNKQMLGMTYRFVTNKQGPHALGGRAPGARPQGVPQASEPQEEAQRSPPPCGQGCLFADFFIDNND